jgi:multiple sugar transport system permease protein
MVAVIGMPMLVSLRNSFWRWKLTSAASDIYFVGFRNYSEVLSDPQLWHAFSITIEYMVLAVSVEVFLGFVIAMLLNVRLRGIALLRAMIFLPMMISDVAGALSWRLLLDAHAGLLNYFIGRLGFPQLLWLGPSLALVSVVLVDIWQNTPFVTLVLLAGLQALPHALSEAARIDGATFWQELRYVILPFLKPFFLAAITFRAIFAMRVFAPVWVLTGGGPADQTMTMGLDIYRAAFRYYDIGVSAAISWVLVALTFGVALAFIRLLGREAMS